MPEELEFAHLYAGFDTPILDLDCGARCAPYNGGIPVCCDTRHSIPAAYPAEWVFLQANTGLWHLWEPENKIDRARLVQEAGSDLVLIECLGAERCEREYRSLVCRAFPFFPYFDSGGRFLGLSYYWKYEDRCWVLSNLDRVQPAYREEFLKTYESVFAARPEELESFQVQSSRMRAFFAAEGRLIPLFHRDGRWRMVDPKAESMNEIDPKTLEKHGPFEISDRLSFPDGT